MIRGEALILRFEEANIDKGTVTMPEKSVPVKKDIANLNDAPIGYASNFRKTDKGIKCDLEVCTTPYDTIVPAYLVKKSHKDKGVIDIELVELGFTMVPEDEKLINNLNIKEITSER